MEKVKRLEIEFIKVDKRITLLENILNNQNNLLWSISKRIPLYICFILSKYTMKKVPEKNSYTCIKKESKKAKKIQYQIIHETIKNDGAKITIFTKNIKTW